MQSLPRVGAFALRVLVVVAVVAGAAAALYLAVVGIDVLLLAFAGVLLALFLRGVTRGVTSTTGLGHGVGLAVVVTLMLGLTVLGGWLMAPAVIEQTAQLVQRVPEALTQLREAVGRTSWGRAVLPHLPSPEALLAMQPAVRAGSTLLATLGWLAGGVASVALVVFIALYVAAAPDEYRGGLLQLVPAPRRARAGAVLAALGETLERWLVGKVVGMVLIGSLTGIGLALLGIPLALALGVIAGLLSFIPYLGPLMSFVPAALLGLSQGPVALLWVVALYAVVQGLESYVVTPLIQRQAVALPPALLIAAQVLLGVAVGGLGLLLATPITAAVVVLVRELYVQEAHEEASGRRRAGRAA
ncbi:MAG TPA: AI-2E family transporter [Methylomirabilota bacterium]